MALSFKQSLAYFWEQIGKQFVKNGTIDWAQNDETKSGYIKNRTHYLGFEETGDIVTSVGDGLYNMTAAGVAQVPEGFYAYSNYIRMPDNLIDGSANITGFKIKWNGETYYSKTMYDADTAGYGFGNINIYIQMFEKATGETIPPELLADLPELAIHDCPVFGMTLYDPSDGAAVQLFTTEDFGEHMPIELHALVGDGEIKKLDNIFLNDDVIIVKKAAPKTILNPIDITYEENGTDSGYYYFVDKELVFEAGKEYDLILNGKTYSCYANKYNLYDGVPGCMFGNIGDELPGMISNPDANFVMFISSSFVDEGTPSTFIIFEPTDTSEYGTSVKFSLVDPNPAPADAWIAKDADGNMFWEEKTHGIIKGDGQVIVPVREYTLEELEGMLFTQWPQLQEGERYSITLGNSTWETVCSTVSEDGIQLYILGDIYGIMNGQDGIVSNPPLIILQTPVAIEGGIYNIIEFDPDFNPGDVLSGENVRFGITKCDSIKKLDSKYIDWPDTIPVLSKKDGAVYLSLDNLEGTLNETASSYVYSLESLTDFSWEEGSYYTVKTDNNTALLQCIHYSGDMDSPAFWALADPSISNLDGYLALSHLYLSSSTFLVIICYNDGTSIFASPAPTTTLIVQDKQTYIKKVNKYAIPNRLPLIPGSSRDSFQSETYDSQANGIGSIALRKGSQASGYGSLAIGGGGGYQSTQADGDYSIAINYSKAYGNQSIACANGQTTDKAHYALAYGYNAVAGSEYQIVLGKNNILDSNNIYGFIFGNGESVNPQNALTINWNGNVWAKNLYMGGTSETEGASKVATETFVNNKLTNILTKSDLIYTTNEAKNLFAGPSGAFNKDFDLGSYSFTWGALALGQGYASTAIGSSATVYDSNFSTAIGYKATVYDGADYSVAIGSEATVSYNADHSFAIGHGATANSSEQIALGKYNRPLTGYSLMLGNGSGTATASRSNAFAVTTTGTGYFAGDLYVNGNGATNTFTGAKKVATESYVDTKVAGLVDSAPGTLDTLNELAAALGDDPNFATTVATEIGKKADKKDLVALTEAEILEVCGVTAVAHISEVTW